MTDRNIFDAHSDLPFRVVREREAGRSSVVEEDFLPGMHAGDIGMRVAAIYIDDAYLPEMALHRALTVTTELCTDVAESEGVRLVTAAEDVTSVGTANDVGLILGMEGAEPLMGDPRLLDVFYQLGLRVVTLTHSRRNAVGDGVPLSGSRRGTPGGLSAVGISTVERAAELGIVIDLSHLTERGFDDAIAAVDQPVIASHSNCRALCDHPRNLTDRQLHAVAATGGVVCLTAVGSFLGESPEVDTLCDHIVHAVDVAGVDHVGLGLDFFDYLFDYLSERERDRLAEIPTVEGLDGDREAARLPTLLSARGFSSQEVKAICRTNLQRTVERVLS